MTTNKYEVLREVWKSVAVPSVIIMGKDYKYEVVHTIHTVLNIYGNPGKKSRVKCQTFK